MAHLESLGVPPGTSYRRCLPGGPWQRLLPGVVLLRTGEPTRRQLVDGALLHCGDQAVVTGLESLRRQGLKRDARPGEPIHVLLPLHLNPQPRAHAHRWSCPDVMNDSFMASDDMKESFMPSGRVSPPG